MNKEVIKAMNKKEKVESKFQKWWKKNRCKVMRIVLFPLWLLIKLFEKIDEWSFRRNKWNEERAYEVLSYYIPRRARWCEEVKEFYFFDNGYGWNIGSAKRYLKLRDRDWWKYNKGWSGGKIREYLIEKFELDGFEKEVLDTDDGWTEIIFKMIENGG